MSNEAYKQHFRDGLGWQLAMLIFWVMRRYQFDPKAGSFDLTGLLTLEAIMSILGLGVMGTSMLRIYRHGLRKKVLITDDLFAWTRHPMYHGMVFADLSLFLVADLSDSLFWETWIAFLLFTFMASYYQEKETLARWGDEARAYYARTPRFIFEWLWWRPKTA